MGQAQINVSITAVVSTQRRVAGHSTVTVAECIVTRRWSIQQSKCEGRLSW